MASRVDVAGDVVPHGGACHKTVSSTDPPTDGRRTRWDAHRAERRNQIIEAGLQVLAEVGADFGLDQVADRAGITKPVIYRHFTDRAGLVEAMSERAMTTLIEGRILPGLHATDPLLVRIRSTLDAVLAYLEDNPNAYWLFVAPGQPGDAEVTRTKELVAGVLAALLGDFLRAARADAGAAEVWAHALIGFVHNTAEWWLDRHTMSRERLTEYLTVLVWAQIDGLARRHGLEIDPDQPLSPESLARQVGDGAPPCRGTAG